MMNTTTMMNYSQKICNEAGIIMPIPPGPFPFPFPF